MKRRIKIKRLREGKVHGDIMCPFLSHLPNHSTAAYRQETAGVSGPEYWAKKNPVADIATGNSF
jgi:hypothetical protein